MKTKNIMIVISILFNVVLFTYIYWRESHLKEMYSNLSFGLQGDLVQLESTIEYQNNNKWNDENVVLEKIEDVREGIHQLMVTGINVGMITKSQENDLWTLYRYFANFPTYTGFPNTKLENNDINKLIRLRDDLRSAGWGTNLGYSSDWASFSMKIEDLTN
ncbi:hypothetical protein [Paenibacillus xylanilyticus]|uniref:Uncharacterized protein n=1 Tax=Paenibacillus xylanilyticus TaxID=248903 RepID=A0A7Y6BZ57_9BACL|nr:hypothetical protein [Paenibacillus xylanilyticus]NUU77623.1 hypothetical protein [Paenibacillus xylanilyticus]